MKHALTELVSVILRRIEEHPEAPVSEPVLRQWLNGQGYKKRDIDAAMRLVRPHVVRSAPMYGERQPGLVRILSEHEARKLAPAARAALARLDLLEMIGPHEREMILDRIFQYDGEIGLEELDYILSWAIYSVRDVESQQTILNVLEGEKKTLN